MTNAASTSNSENPCSFDDRDPAGQPVDVDVVFTLAGGERDPPAVRAAIGIKPDRADLVAQQIALRGEEFELDLLGQPMRALVGRYSKRARLEVELEHRFGTLRDGAVARQAQPGSDIARRGLQVGA